MRARRKSGGTFFAHLPLRQAFPLPPPLRTTPASSADAAFYTQKSLSQRTILRLSLTQKEASATAAILASIGLLTAPMEQAEADVPTVSEVILTDWVVFDSGWFDMDVVHSSGSGAQWNDVKYCWSGIYWEPILAQWGLTSPLAMD